MKREHLKVYWEVDDGYAGGHRPQTSRIPVEEFEEGMSRDEIQNLLQEYVQEDFEQTIGPAFSDLDGAVDEALKIVEGREQE